MWYVTLEFAGEPTQLYAVRGYAEALHVVEGFNGAGRAHTIILETQAARNERLGFITAPPGGSGGGHGQGG